ncbi:uncharacterized protein LOC135689910 [Rhopilema esculentum]|uniref:uncharacterized protein LOC135689910 n=1 Tax=Rhopilema esculentum TaxID=499914 RepID=UPI0031E2623D|eukprot:gene8617-14629_t
MNEDVIGNTCSDKANEAVTSLTGAQEGDLKEENLQDSKNVESDQQMVDVLNDIDPGIARLRFLQLISRLKGKEAVLQMHEKTKVKGIFEAIDIEGNTIAVKSLETPIGKQHAALIRVTDVVSMSIEA